MTFIIYFAQFQQSFLFQISVHCRSKSDGTRLASVHTKHGRNDDLGAIRQGTSECAQSVLRSAHAIDTVRRDIPGFGAGMHKKLRRSVEERNYRRCVRVSAQNDTRLETYFSLRGFRRAIHGDL